MMPPYNYDYRNVMNSTVFPATERISTTGIAKCFKRYLLQKAISVFEYKLPENWVDTYFYYLLYEWGYLSVINTDIYGVIPQHCTLSGFGVQYQPVRALISNPLIQINMDLVIGRNVEIIRLMPDYGGIRDLLDIYGDMMSLCLESLGVNILNSRLAYLFYGSNKSDTMSWKRALDDVLSGKPGVVLDKSLQPVKDGKPLMEPFQQNVGQNFISPQILEVWGELEDRFDHEIGIPTANTDKKERLISDEVNTGTKKTYFRADLWLETLQECFEKVRNLFGIPESELSVDWRVNPNQQMGGVMNDSTSINLNSNSMENR